MKLTPAALRTRLKKVRLVLTDVDGVLTGGTIYHFVDTAGELVEFKGIHAQDSIALAWLAESGVPTGVISGRVSKGTAARLRILKVKHIYQHRLDKAAVFAEILKAEGLNADQALYLGDDIPDLAVLTRAGLAVAPANARPEVKAAAHWVTKARGGDGAFREAAEALLKARGLWTAILEKYR
ncbi:MAG: HAD hydrolase family protein [Elusimicrobia bacterium]|nr:HAD hydrolase family protein [Elusimicrobiota bacterium]